MKILISTFGPNAENTLAAMRALPYKRLVLVLSKEDVETPGYKQVKETEMSSMGEVEEIFVDKYDLRDCFRSIVGYVNDIFRSESKKRNIGNIISINISGGTKIMGDAALLAAFQTGVKAYHCEKGRVIRLPVIEGITLRDRLTDSQVAVLREMGARDTVEDIGRKIGNGLTEETIRKSLRKLRRIGVIKTVISEGKVVAELTESGIFILETINRMEKAH